MYKLDLETGELEIFLEKAYFPTYIEENKSFLLLDSEGHAKIVDLEGNITKELPIIKQDYNSKITEDDDILYCFELEYTDGNVIGINNENIFIYNISTEEITKIKNKEHYYLIGTGNSKIFLLKETKMNLQLDHVVHFIKSHPNEAVTVWKDKGFNAIIGGSLLGKL